MCAGSSTSATSSVKSVSTEAYSSLIVWRHSPITSLKASTFSLGNVSTTSALRGMALRIFPPFQLDKQAEKFTIASCTMRAIVLLALQRPSLISRPEWPPLSLSNETLTATSSLSVSWGLYSSVAVIFTPPAEPIIISPSVSSSRLSRISPSSTSAFIWFTPYMVVSSSAVMKPSTGPCFKVLSSITAIMVATAIPSSEPRVVPLAFTQSPSI